MAVFAPMPSASVMTATAVKTGVFHSVRHDQFVVSHHRYYHFKLVCVRRLFDHELKFIQPRHQQLKLLATGATRSLFSEELGMATLSAWPWIAPSTSSRYC